MKKITPLVRYKRDGVNVRLIFYYFSKKQLLISELIRTIRGARSEKVAKIKQINSEINFFCFKFPRRFHRIIFFSREIPLLAKVDTGILVLTLTMTHIRIRNPVLFLPLDLGWKKIRIRILDEHPR
jgi:hypothetical protein